MPDPCLYQSNPDDAQADTKETYKQEADIDTFQVDTIPGPFDYCNADGPVLAMATCVLSIARLFANSHSSYTDDQPGIQRRRRLSKTPKIF